jgi:hypothetical protein
MTPIMARRPLLSSAFCWLRNCASVFAEVVEMTLPPQTSSHLLSPRKLSWLPGNEPPFV